jgi:acyl-CoA thioester hydrolase
MDAENSVASLLEGYQVIVTLPVLWGDQDALGHVNNTVYFRWLESARIEHGRRSGLLTLLEQERIGPILAAQSCNYRMPLTFPDTVHIGIRVVRIGRTSVSMEHLIVSEAHAAIAADGTSTTVVLDYCSNRPHPVPEHIRQAIEALEGRQLGA